MGHTDTITTQLYLRAFNSRQARQGGISVLESMGDVVGAVEANRISAEVYFKALEDSLPDETVDAPKLVPTPFGVMFPLNFDRALRYAESSKIANQGVKLG